MVFKVVSGADGNVTAMQMYDSENSTEEFTFSALNVTNQNINIYMNRLASSVFWDSPYQVSNILSRTTKITKIEFHDHSQFSTQLQQNWETKM